MKRLLVIFSLLFACQILPAQKPDKNIQAFFTNFGWPIAYHRPFIVHCMELMGNPPADGTNQLNPFNCYAYILANPNFLIQSENNILVGLIDVDKQGIAHIMYKGREAWTASLGLRHIFYTEPQLLLYTIDEGAPYSFSPKLLVAWEVATKSSPEDSAYYISVHSDSVWSLDRQATGYVLNVTTGIDKILLLPRESDSGRDAFICYIPSTFVKPPPFEGDK